MNGSGRIRRAAISPQYRSSHCVLLDNRQGGYPALTPTASSPLAHRNAEHDLIPPRCRCHCNQRRVQQRHQWIGNCEESSRHLLPDCKKYKRRETAYRNWNLCLACFEHITANPLSLNHSTSSMARYQSRQARSRSSFAWVGKDS